MINPSGLKLCGSALWTATTMLFSITTLASSSEPCPPASTLHPCSCFDQPLYSTDTTEPWWWSTTGAPYNYTTEPWWWSTTDTSYYYTTEPWWSTTTSTPHDYGTTAARRRRRREMREKRYASTTPTTRIPYFTEVMCDNINSTHELEDVMGEGLKKRGIDVLILSRIQPTYGDNLVRFPSDMLKNTRVKALLITNTPLHGSFIHSGNPLAGQNESMLGLVVQNCSLRGQLSYSDVGTVNTMGLQNLCRLEVVDFSVNHLECINTMAFRHAPVNLTHIILSHNHIEVIQPGAFRYVSKLTHLDMSHNDLKFVQRNIFASPAKNLSRINFSYNMIMSLPADFFSKMPELRSVDFSNNFLYCLSSKPWAPVWKQLHVVNVTGNYFSCDCSLMWLAEMQSRNETNGTSTVQYGQYDELQEQEVIGQCYVYRDYYSYPEYYDLSRLTPSSIRCSKRQ